MTRGEYIPLVTGGGTTSVDKIEFIWVNTMLGKKQTEENEHERLVGIR